MINKDDFTVSVIEEYQETLEDTHELAKRLLHEFKRRKDGGFLQRMYNNRLAEFEHRVFILSIETEQIAKFLVTTKEED